MKLKAPGATAATARSPINWFLGIFLAAFLTIISASSAVGKTGARGLNPAEEWVVAQATAGKIADLDGALNADHTKKFPDGHATRCQNASTWRANHRGDH